MVSSIFDKPYFGYTVIFGQPVSHLERKISNIFLYKIILQILLLVL